MHSQDHPGPEPTRVEAASVVTELVRINARMERTWAIALVAALVGGALGAIAVWRQGPLPAALAAFAGFVLVFGAFEGLVLRPLRTRTLARLQSFDTDALRVGGPFPLVERLLASERRQGTGAEASPGPPHGD